MKIKDIREEASKIRTTQHAQHDRIKKCILGICDQLEILSSDATESIKEDVDSQPDIKGATPTFEKLLTAIKEKKGDKRNA